MKQNKKTMTRSRAGRRRASGTRWPLLLLAALLLPVLTACGGGDSAGSGSVPAGSAAEPAQAAAHDTLSVVSMNRFKQVAARFGEVEDLSGDYGFDACTVIGADEANYIYMYLPDGEMARQLVTDEDGDGAMDDSIEILQQGGNYEYYREQVDENEIDDSSGQSAYGYYLRVDNMLLLAVGQSAQETTVRSQAEAFFDALGYQLPAA